MSLPSPFSFLDWDAKACTILVRTTDQSTADKLWGLVSVDGTPAEAIIGAAKKEEGDKKWMHNFAVMFPNYALMASMNHGSSFVVTGNASVELEDLDSHEITEMTLEATDDAYLNALQNWTHDNDHLNAKQKEEVETNGEGNGDEDYEDVDEDDEEGEEQSESYLDKRHNLDAVAAMFDAANRFAVKQFGLTPKQLRQAFVAAGGKLLTTDEELAYASKDLATQTFLQEAAAAGGGEGGAPPNCPQQ